MAIHGMGRMRMAVPRSKRRKGVQGAEKPKAVRPAKPSKLAGRVSSRGGVGMQAGRGSEYQEDQNSADEETEQAVPALPGKLDIVG